MAHRFDDDVGLGVRRQVTNPPVAGCAHHGVHAEGRADVGAVDRIDAGDLCRTRHLGDVGEQQPDRSLTEDRHVPPGQVGQLFDGIEHTGQRLQGDGVFGAQSPVVGCQSVAVGDDLFHQPVEPRGPADHPVPGVMLGVAAGQHITDHLVDREALFLGGASAGVPRDSSLRAPKSGKVTAADAGGQKTQEHLSVAEGFRRAGQHLGAFEGVRRHQPVRPHVSRPRPGHCSTPIESSKVVATPPSRRRRNRIPA